MQTIPGEREIIDRLVAIYDRRANGRYGLTLVNQRAHAVQSGHHARAQGLPATLVAACLLHDLGHMVHDLGEHPAARGVDDRHEEIAAEWLCPWFGPAVTEPIRLHVAAKRYLCAVETGYHDRLSADSIESLALQGGPMAEAEVAAFARSPYSREAVALRRIDERAKDPSGPMPAFAEFRDALLAALRDGRA